MELGIVSLVVALVLLTWALIRERRLRRKQAQTSGPLPPGPRPWPLVGNIHQLSFSPHRSFARLAKKYGPIMTLHIGAMTTVVISSSSAAREMFKSHDAELSGRAMYEAMKLSSGNDGSMITAQLGAHWRMLRRLCNTGFFTTTQLDAMRGLRRRCVGELVNRIEIDGGYGSRPIDIGRLLFLMAFDHIGRLTLSRNLLDSDSKLGDEFYNHVGRIMELVGSPNVADLVPFLKGLDPQGIRGKMELHVGRALQIVSSFVEERMESKCRGEDGDRMKDFLDLLLEFEGDGVGEPAKLSSRTINAIVCEMIVAGTETNASTMEWMMVELLRHPSAMSKVQLELRQVTCEAKELEEQDVVNLPYLNAVIKETMRLHPPLPLLVPHKATKSCTLLGYHIPQDTQILVNVWGIGQEHESWDDPSAFKPERFIASQLDYNGQHHQFIPFGSGRRMCPAVRLMSRMLPLALGVLLRSFNWSLAGGLRPEDVDMTEHLGITLRKAVPLGVMATPFIKKDY